jgi:hypothetical protein
LSADVTEEPADLTEEPEDYDPAAAANQPKVSLLTQPMLCAHGRSRISGSLDIVLAVFCTSRGCVPRCCFLLPASSSSVTQAAVSTRCSAYWVMLC